MSQKADERGYMKRVLVSMPARLHFGLIDMNGQLSRIDGGIGLALESPHTLIEVVAADTIAAQCHDEPQIAPSH